jgi:hypothetical protein
MKKIFITLALLTIGLSAFAGEKEEALAFFQHYVEASNSYSKEVPNMYSDNAKIIRQVIKPDFELVNVPFSIKKYRTQLKLSSKLAKIRNYKNNYSDIKITKVKKGYKIDAKRQPSLGGPKLRTSTTVQKQPDGKWLIVSETMQTQQQVFLKYAK